jgi:dienelactone hydrolase
VKFLFSLLLLSSLTVAFADGPADNIATSVRPIPPIGEQLGETESDRLATHCDAVRSLWSQSIRAATEAANAQNVVKDNPSERWRRQQHLLALLELESEILVFPRAVELALEFQQFYKSKEVDAASALLQEAERRIRVAHVDPDWRRVVGIDDGEDWQLVVGGYRSKIDGSYQPYAIVIPPGFSGGDSRPRRLDLWFHGRGETLSEVNFLTGGRNSAGQYTPEDTFVLHPYGRYSNAFKFAGEVDVLEALDHVSKYLPVDPARVSVRGFSMGGAACWQFATHYADRFFAANPGAGFSETPEFLKSFQGEDLSSTPDYQKTLWRLYDCPHWSRNLIHCPTVAYSGEIDRQKQAADVMEKSLAGHEIEMVHVIGPLTAHKIHADSKVEIEQRMNSLAAAVEPSVPNMIDFTTQTLRYNRMHWVDVQGLRKHWESANVRADLRHAGAATRVVVSTTNVDRLRLDFAAGQWVGYYPCRPKIVIDGQELAGSPVRSDRSWRADLVLKDGRWQPSTEDLGGLRKRHGLQGPIDDAFMDSFLFVLPTGTSTDPALAAWTSAESQHAQLQWRKHFRGDSRSVTDRELTAEQIADHNLVLFGDPESNSVIARIAKQLPVAWSENRISLGSQSFPRNGLAVAMIYPNPLNPDRYVVLNSGFTFREYDYLNNARQTPKLPDWAIIDTADGSTSRDPGKIRSAGFFDERWLPES